MSVDAGVGDAGVGPGPSSIPLDVTHNCRIDLGLARRAFLDPSWLGPSSDDPDDPDVARRFATDLEMPVQDGRDRGVVRKAALIDLGLPEDTEDALVVPVSWRSATIAPLFPVFTGRLQVTARGLALHGRYAPPFGRLGLVIDAALLHFVARRTGQAFLARVAAHLAE